VYGGNFYGTLKSEIDRIWAEGKVVIFDVDVVGGLNLKKHFEDKALAIFVKPPSVEILAQRLKERSTETEETLQVRIGKAVLELAYENKFETVLLNENLADALQKAEQMVNDFIAK
jgi:guanylate kinase